MKVSAFLYSGMAVLLILSAGLTIQAATYFVSPSGADTGPGTEALPWRTIQKAADTMVAGDTVYIKVGTYSERVVPQNSGSAGNFIAYTANPGETAVIDGAGVDVPEWAALFDLTGRAYIRVSGLRILNSVSNPHNPGILADGSDHIVIENNYVYNTNDSGIGVWSSHDVTVARNEVERACRAMWNECISVGGSDTVEVRSNLVHDSEKEGICIKDGSSNVKAHGNEVFHTAAVGFYVDAQDDYTHDIEVYGNVSHDGVENGFALASEVGGLLENVKVYNNTAYANGWTGLQVTACCIATHPMSDIWIVNNTFYDNGRGEWGGGIYLENPQAQGVVIRNNLLSRNLTFQLAVDPMAGFTADHNLIDGFRGGEGEITGDACVEGDPQFVDAAGADFHILETSPAVDQGSAMAAPVMDFDGTPRPQGSGFDIGAFEYRRYRHIRPVTRP
jgi:parallel beta-helix repeat protein